MKSSNWALLVFVVAAALSLDLRLLAQAGSAPEIKLAESSNQALFPAVLQSGFRYWSNAYLITIDAPPFMVPDKPGVILYDRYGAVARQATVWLDGAADVSVTDAAVSPSGSLFVGGGALNKDGAVANFIVEIGSDDRVRRVVRTTPFVPRNLCALDDGTVWAYGFDRDAHDMLVENSPRLRQYSFEKGRLQALLDTSTLPDVQAFRETWHFPQGRYVGEVNLRCNAKKVVFYNGGTGDLAEFDPKKNAMTLTKVAALPEPATLHITGFALTSSGEIFASFHDRSNTKAPVSGLFQLSRDNAGGAKWVAVPGTVGLYLKNSPIERLWGADGDSLVFSRSKDGRLFWTK
jgi:hypothetical protein